MCTTVGAFDKIAALGNATVHVEPILFVMDDRVATLQVCTRVLQCVAVCCRVLQCVAMYCCVLLCVVVCCSVLQRVAMCCSVVQCGAVCCNVLHRVAVRGNSARLPVRSYDGPLYTRIRMCVAVICFTEGNLEIY